MSLFLSLNLISQILLLYIIAINIIAFFFFGLDKLKSQLNKRRRISEKTLWFLALLGGSPGSIFGMYFFIHKTKKDSFQIVLALILGAQIIMAVLFFFK